MGDFNASKYRNDFNKEKYDRLSFFVPKGTREKIAKYAKEHGYKSTNNFLQDCVLKSIEEKEKSKTINIGEINQGGENNNISF